MKFETLTWEEGFVGGRVATTPCVFVTVRCVPNWFCRKVLRQKSWEINVYGEKKESKTWIEYYWYNADTGYPLSYQDTSYQDSLSAHLFAELQKSLSRRKAMIMKTKINRAAKE